MRSELEILARAWARPLPILFAVAFLAGGAGARYGAITPYTTGLSYVAALMGAALALAVSSSTERAAWSRPSQRQDVQLLLAVGMSSVFFTLALGLAMVGAPSSPLELASILGCGHLAALALVVRRAPLGPVWRAIGFLVVATVLPALAPILRPLLDASPSFRAGHFPRWSEALAPILSLIVIAIALPARAPLVPAGDPTT